MANINIPAVASGAFLGLMALAALIWCFPPITRFLGDLCCCPWRIPFTRKKRENDDEEMDKDDLPYDTVEPHAGTPVDSDGYHRMSAAYMSAVSVVDPETAMEEARRSADRRRSRSSQGDLYNGLDQHLQGNHHEGMPYNGPHLQVPHPNMAHPIDWRRSSPDRPSNYPVQPSYGDEYLSYSGHGYDTEYDVQPPEPSYPPPTTVVYQHRDGYLPVAESDRPGLTRQQHSDENVAGPRQWSNI